MSSHVRERVTHDEAIHHYLYTHPNTGSSINDAGTFPSFTKYSYIEDRVGVHKSARGFYVPKYVKSIKFVYDGHAGVGPWLADHGLTASPLPGTPPHMGVANVTTLLPSLSDALWGDMAEKAFNSFSDVFPESISSSEFTLGLAKLKDLLPSISGSVLKDVSGAYLSKKFGWDNLLSDLTKLAGLFNELSERMKFLKSTYGKPVKMGYFQRDVIPLLSILPTGGLYLENTLFRGQTTRIQLLDYQCDFRAGCRLLQRLSHIDDTIGWIRSVTGALGLHNPLKSVWVNLPFSFVVDWFLGVSQHLDKLARVKPAEQWDLSDLTCSMSEKARFKVVIRHTDLNGSPNQEYTIGHITAERYTRRVGLPLSSEFITVSELNPKQLTLLGAMLS